MFRSLSFLLSVPLAVTTLAYTSDRPLYAQSHVFSVGDSSFQLDGRPYQIISGEMHYPRVPREYWRDRLHKAKQMGLNTITTYAFWNVHEPRPGVFNFTGQNDLAEYLREAQAEGLNVILRPGPYVCAEWELGGFPPWLLKDRDLTLRSSDPKFMAAVSQWFERLAQEVKPLLLKNGGPIIAIQVENEYGAYGDDKTYLEGIRNELVKAGLGDAVELTSNQASDLARGSLADVTSAVNFGGGNATAATAKLEAFRPGGPRMVGEYWAGWFDKWGEAHHQTEGHEEAAELRFLLERGYAVSLYMFHGGTSFGWMNGADSHTGTDYHPDTTSYDYDAPLDESGNPRYKYALFQEAISKAMHTHAGPLPGSAPHAIFPIAPAKLSASLWRNLPTPVNSNTPLSFEDLGQNYGYVLYRTGLDEGDGGTLLLQGIHDYAQVYIDQQLVGTLDRRLGQSSIELPSQRHASTLDILVENTGRVNYSHAIQTEQAGLTGPVTIGGKTPRNWENFSLPMEDLSRLRFLQEPCTGPCFFETSMTVNKPADTFLDTRGLHKGQLWLGAHNLGRFWSIGPQFTLYAPGPWLQKGTTRLLFFDLLSDGNEPLTTVKEAVFGDITHEQEKQ